MQQRGAEEAFGLGIESRCRLAAQHYRPPLGANRRADPRDTLYNSIYRADDDMFVNAHVWGMNAYGAPVWHLRRHDEDGAFDTYVESFDSIWRQATPLREGDA